MLLPFICDGVPFYIPRKSCFLLSVMEHFSVYLEHHCFLVSVMEYFSLYLENHCFLLSVTEYFSVCLKRQFGKNNSYVTSCKNIGPILYFKKL